MSTGPMRRWWAAQPHAGGGWLLGVSLALASGGLIGLVTPQIGPCLPFIVGWPVAFRPRLRLREVEGGCGRWREGPTRTALWLPWAPHVAGSQFGKGGVQTGHGRQLTDCACAGAVCVAASGCANPRLLLTSTPALMRPTPDAPHPCPDAGTGNAA